MAASDRLPDQPRHQGDNQTEVTVLPALALGFRAFERGRKLARYDGVLAEKWRVAGHRQVGPEFLILGKLRTRELDGANHRPGEGHSGAHQATWQAQRAHAQWTDPVSHAPRKL